MAKILTEPELITIISAGEIVEGGIDKSVEGIKYDFRLGTRILRSGAKEINTEKLTETERAELGIEPGEMVFVLSEEKLNLPSDIKVELSNKRKLSHCGILVGGGVCVDPRYTGFIVLLLYNFSSTRFPLRPGDKLIAGIFYKLDKSEVSEVRVEPESIEKFPDDVRALMREYIPFSPNLFNEAIKKFEIRLGSIDERLKERDKWIDDFQAGLNELKVTIGELTSDLKLESSLRQSKDEEIETKQTKVDENLSKVDEKLFDIKSTVKFLKWAIITLIGTIVIVYVINFLLTK